MNEICILGGGPFGIGIGKNLIQAGIDNFTIIESADNFGGTWYFGSENSLVYESTHLISSKKNTEFSDYPMPEDYPPFASHQQFLAYLRDTAEYFGLYQHVLFNTTVTKVQPKGDRWEVSLSTGESRDFATLIVANGRLREPITPDYPGKFSGEAFHAKHYKHPDCLRRKKVLIVGAGNTGCDIAMDSVYYAEKTFFSTRRPYYYTPKFIDGKPYQDWIMEKSGEFPSKQAFWEHAKKIFKQAGYDPTDYGLEQPDYSIDQLHPIVNSLILHHIGHGALIPKPDIQKFEKNQVYFKDGSEEKIDVLIYATGYEIALPFFDKSLLSWKNGLPDNFLGFDRCFDNLIFVGYFNSAAGLGNVLNSYGKLIVAYLKAKEKDSAAYQTFCRLKQGPEPDIGRDYYTQTKIARNRYEVDLWKTLRVINTLESKLNS